MNSESCNGIRQEEIVRLISKFSGFYLMDKTKYPGDIISEVQYAILKALRSWNPNKVNSAKFSTYSDRIVKNHMARFLKKEGKYKRTMSQEIGDYIDHKSNDPIAAFEAVSANAFDGEAEVITREFIKPSEAVIRTIGAFECKFKGQRSVTGFEAQMLKNGAHCFSISVVHGIPINRVLYVKRKLVNYLKMC